MANALINQKYASSIFDYFQSKAHSFQQHPASYLTNTNTSQNPIYQQYLQNSSNSNSASSSIPNNNCTSNGNAYQNHAAINQNNSLHYLEEFKKPLANFASFMQDASYYNQSKLAEKTTTHHSHNNNNAMSAIHNNTYSGGDLSSNSSSCGSENSGLDSLKETQLRISESCNLVNDI